MVDRLERFVNVNTEFWKEDLIRRHSEFKLKKGEQSILGYFPSSAKASRALRQIKNLGFEIAQLDRVSRYGVSVSPEQHSPVDGHALSQTGLSLTSSRTYPDADDNERLQPAALPSISGMSSEGYETYGGESFLVTVVAESARVPEVVQVIKENGGSV